MAPTTAGQFNTFRHGYAGTIHRGQGRTLDQTYLYHSRYMRSTSSYVALTRHREHTTIFVARETAADLGRLTRQMARVDDRRAASQFHEAGLVNERAETSTARQNPADERQRKIDEVVQRMKQQRERDRGDRDR
jgi:ATP-dependent exoDNAse (exonuclease V) alpha subunit